MPSWNSGIITNRTVNTVTMARTGGEQTRARILKAAEALFGERGFDATSVDAIARAAGVNKALIYYHFADKRDVVRSLFAQIIDEIEGAVADPPELRGVPADLPSKIRAELALLEPHRQILSVMLAEAMRSGALSHALFDCAELVVRQEQRRTRPAKGRARRRHLVHEFFTGFLPLVAFVALRQRFCEHFQIDSDEALDLFLEAFARSHLASHL